MGDFGQEKMQSMVNVYPSLDHNVLIVMVVIA